MADSAPTGLSAEQAIDDFMDGVEYEELLDGPGFARKLTQALTEAGFTIVPLPAGDQVEAVARAILAEVKQGPVTDVQDGAYWEDDWSLWEDEAQAAITTLAAHQKRTGE